jgi:hypothetical protein
MLRWLVAVCVLFVRLFGCQVFQFGWSVLVDSGWQRVSILYAHIAADQLQVRVGRDGR